MERTRVIIQVGVTFDVNTYASAGEVLDQIDRKLSKVLGKVDGTHEITGFQTRPCKAMKFDRQVYETPMSMDEGQPMAEPLPMQAMER